MLLKLHLLTVTLSLLGFIFRGGLMIIDSPLMKARPIRIAPHVVDTLLLLSGIGMVVSFERYPWEQPWLAAKLFLLLIYIVIGTVALKRGRTKTIRVTAWFAALAVFAAMLTLARTKQLPF